MNEKLGQFLAERLEGLRAHERIEVHIYLRQGLPVERSPASDRAEVMARAIAEAEASQVPLITDLAEAFAPPGDGGLPGFVAIRRFWINNVLMAEVSSEALDAILARSDVERVELVSHSDLRSLLDSTLPIPNLTLSLPAVPAIAWQVKAVNAPQLWKIGLRGEPVLVAVIDSGVNYDHPDLSGRMWDGGAQYPLHGYDFATPGSDPRDTLGHGTACAGLIAGDGSSGTVTGVARQARIMALRVGGLEGDVWAAFQFALAQGADIVSLSLSWKQDHTPDDYGWRRACELLVAAGLVHASSTGNEGDVLTGAFQLPHNIPAPARCPPPWMNPAQVTGGLSSAIAFGATGTYGRLRSSGSGPAAWETPPYADYPYNNGALQGLLRPDLCAPGPGSETCDWTYTSQPPGGVYRSDFGGTSAATATSAGCLALLVHATKRANKPVLPARMQEAVEESAVPLSGQTGKQNNLGSGRIDVYAAYWYGHQKGWWS